MKRLLKLLSVLVLFIIIAIIALNLAVKSYLKKDKIKSLVVPKAEKALGRRVDIGDVSVSLFKGVTLKEFVIKEQDGKTNFLKIKEFVLKYKILPLIKKRIVISKIKIDSPYVRIFRDSRGKFNYETLRILEQKSKKSEKGKEARRDKTLPFSLTVEKIEVVNAHVIVEDALKEIPDTDAKADASITLSMGKDGLIFKGRSNFSAQLLYGVKILLHGKLSFTNTNINYLVDVDVEGEKLTLSGDIRDYTKKPSVLLKVSSSFIDLAKLKSITEKFPEKSSKVSKKRKVSTSEVPITLNGNIKISKLSYDKIVVKDLKCFFSFKDKEASLKQLNLKIFEGNINGNGIFNIYSKTYKGNLDIDNLDLGKLLPLLFIGKPYITGISQFSLSFSGRGMNWSVAKKYITARGNFSLKDGRFVNVEAVNALSSLLKLEELKDLSFKKLEGNFKIEKGKLFIKSVLNNPYVKIKTRGYIGLDGRLSLPLIIKLSPELSAKLVKRVKFASYLPRDNGWVVVPIKLGGYVNKPIPVPDVRLEEQLKREGLKIIEQAIGGKGTDSKSEGKKGVLQQLLGH